MSRGPAVCGSVVACCLLLAAVAGCTTSRAQQLSTMRGALGSRYVPDGPTMGNDAEPVGTHEPELALIPADSALHITLVSASLIPLPGFRVPRLLSTGVVPGACPGPTTAFPSANGKTISVTVSGRHYRPLPLPGYRMLIGAGCVPQIVYVVQAGSAGQYAVGGLRVLVRYGGRVRAMFAYYGIDVWFYGLGPLPSASQVTHGLRAAFAAQLAIYRHGGR
jgi:hypothetical protein